MSYQPTKQVLEVGNLNIKGNIIPEAWWQNIKYENGKPNFLAVIILSEIVYWYRPTEVRDEATGKVSGYKKKFKSDFLQRDTKNLAEKFGVSYKQANDALNFLQDKNLIVRHKRNITYGQGRVCSNVQFIEVAPANIKKITTYLHACNHPLTCREAPSDVNVSTYTETTTETTTFAEQRAREEKEKKELSDAKGKTSAAVDLPPPEPPTCSPALLEYPGNSGPEAVPLDPLISRLLSDGYDLQAISNVIELIKKWREPVGNPLALARKLLADKQKQGYNSGSKSKKTHTQPQKKTFKKKNVTERWKSLKMWGYCDEECWKTINEELENGKIVPDPS